MTQPQRSYESQKKEQISVGSTWMCLERVGVFVNPKNSRSLLFNSLEAAHKYLEGEALEEEDVVQVSEYTRIALGADSEIKVLSPVVGNRFLVEITKGAHVGKMVIISADSFKRQLAPMQ